MKFADIFLCQSMHHEQSMFDTQVCNSTQTAGKQISAKRRFKKDNLNGKNRKQGCMWAPFALTSRNPCHSPQAQRDDVTRRIRGDARVQSEGERDVESEGGDHHEAVEHLREREVQRKSTYQRICKNLLFYM